MSEKLKIGITMGDPASIGPEITVRAFADKALYEMCNPVVIGDADVLAEAVKIVGKPEIRINSIDKISDARFEFGTIDVY